MAFDFAKFGSFGAKPKSTTSVKVDPKASFVAACNQNIVALLDNAEPSKGDWFKVDADGSVVVVLKTGIRVLPVEDDSNYMVVPNKSAAVAYLQGVAKAAKDGDLDKYFARAAELTALANANKKPSTPKKKTLSEAEVAARIAAAK